MKKFAILINIFAMALPVAFFCKFVMRAAPSQVVYSIWMFLAAVCLCWGIYVSRWSRLGGWLCVGMAIVQFVLAILPLFLKAR